MLEHHVHRSTVGGHIVHTLATDVDVSLIGFIEPGEESQQRGLAATGGSQNREKRARRHVQGHMIHRGIAAEPADQSLTEQVRIHSHGNQFAAWTRSST